MNSPIYKIAAMFQGRDIPQHILDAIRTGNKAVLSRGGKAIKKKKPSAVIPPVEPIPVNTPNARAISPDQLSLGLPVNRARISGRANDMSNWIFNGPNGSEAHGGMVQATPEMLEMWRNNPTMK